MESLGRSLFFVLVVATLLALARGNADEDEEYNVMVSRPAFEHNGGCHKLVIVTGKGVHDQVPVACDMVEYVVANSLNLVVGITLFSDRPGTMTVVREGSCEQRTYKNSVLHHTEVLSPTACEDVRLTMLVFMAEHVEDNEWNEDDQGLVFTNGGQKQDYGEWKNVISDIWKTDSDKNTDKAAKDATQ